MHSCKAIRRARAVATCIALIAIVQSAWAQNAVRPMDQYLIQMRKTIPAKLSIATVHSDSTTFTDIGAGLFPVGHGTVAWGDFDNDGDLDLLVNGIGVTDTAYPRLTKIYRNDNGTFVDIGAPLAGVNNNNGGAVWLDYDNDGRLDVFVNGALGPNRNQNTVSKLYHNDGGGIFTEVATPFTPLAGTAAAGDYDRDGNIDLLITGSPNDCCDIQSDLYHNNGDGTFTFVPMPLMGVWGASCAFGDYDNDGDLDLIITGLTDNYIAGNTKLYRNENGVYHWMPMDLPPVWASSVAWGDYDNDGDLDLAISGRLSNVYPERPITRIFRNDHGHFVESGIPIIDVDLSALAWGDFDNDGDLDLVITGTPDLGASVITKVYRNDGNGVFTDMDVAIPGTWYSSVAWGDYNGDGYLDLAISGFTFGSPVTRIYRNNLGSGTFSANTSPVSPGSLQSSVSRDTVRLRWDRSTDGETPQAGLSYNLRIGRAAGALDIMSPMADLATGSQKVVRIGNAGGNNQWSIRRLSTGTYSWSVQAVDNGFAGSQFSPEQGFTVDLHLDTNQLFTDINAPLKGLAHGTVAWGDYDNDGDLDLLVNGLANDPTDNYTILYRNDSGNFIDTHIPFVGLHNNNGAEWADFDNDGDLDFFINGSMGPRNQNAVSILYRNDGNGHFTALRAPFMQLAGTATWGDYDNDGYVDLLVTGSPDDGGSIFTKLYHNNSAHASPPDSEAPFTESANSFVGVWGASCAFGDYDNDGDLDLLVTGLTDNHIAGTTRLYRNDNGTFVEVPTSLPPVWASAVAWADYDNDGDLDLVISGRLSDVDPQRPITRIYRNDGNGVFTDIHAPLVDVDLSSVSWGDFDNDGDLDLLVIGSPDFGATVITKLYRNDGNNTFTDMDIPIQGAWYSSIVWGDYDNDGDLDFALNGWDPDARTAITKIFRNNRGGNSFSPNTPPTTPAGLASSVKGSGSVVLNWKPSLDDQRPAQAISYNVRIGTAPRADNILSAHSDLATGYRRVPRLGNSQYDTTYLGKALSPGVYYWSVQAVDNTFTGSTFSAEKTFYISPTSRWNLISVPFDHSDLRTTSVFPGAGSKAFSYAGGKGYSSSDVLRHGLGYWLKLPGGPVVMETGGNPRMLDTIDLQSDWNLIGSISASVPTNALRQIPSGNIISNYFGFNNGYQRSSVIEPGKGYWVKARAPGILIVSSAGSAPKVSAGDPAEDLLSNTSQLHFEDALGQQQSLYLNPPSEGLWEINAFQLPPSPPEGAFDVRYASGRMMERWEEGKSQAFVILIATPNYPVTVRTIVVRGSPGMTLSSPEGTFPLKEGNPVVLRTPADRITLRIAAGAARPTTFSLAQNFPNPFNPTTRIEYALPVQSRVTLKVFNTLGQVVAILADEVQQAGVKSVEFDAGYLPTGLYIYRLQAGGFVGLRKMLVVK
ncbi:MAG TPA: FG-GAP-like repeat-containing protein [Bacteroidota bacterium]|nr:FG-GAP-like repeat-containing protein [Bacteroidota bacterium]